MVAADPAVRLGNQVEAAAKRLERQTGVPVIVCAIGQDVMGVRVDYYVAGPTPAEHEFALFAQLQRLVGEVEEGAAAGCPDCTDRLDRVNAAIAALAPGFGPGASGPRGTC